MLPVRERYWTTPRLTLNRLELTPARANTKSRYKKIVARQRDIAA